MSPFSGYFSCFSVFQFSVWVSVKHINILLALCVYRLSQWIMNHQCLGKDLTCQSGVFH